MNIYNARIRLSEREERDERYFRPPATDPPLNPPRSIVGTPAWLGQKLFGSVFNTIVTLFSALVVAALIWPAIKFMLIDAVWDGSSRVDCLEETVKRPVGACWPFVAAKFAQFMYGFYPADQVWRVNLTYAVGLALSGAVADPARSLQDAQRASVLRCIPDPGVLPAGRRRVRTPHVETRLWGGLW